MSEYEDVRQQGKRDMAQQVREGRADLTGIQARTVLQSDTFVGRWQARDQGQTLAQERERWEAFQRLVARHDLTFDFSDDPRVRQRGRQELQEITRQAPSFPRHEVARIWNAMVDRNVIASARPAYYWEHTHGLRERKPYDER